VRSFLLVTAILFSVSPGLTIIASASSAAVPVLDLEPNPVTGDQVTAAGKNLCGDPGVRQNSLSQGVQNQLGVDCASNSEHEIIRIER
jgi:hypothetical protein